MDIKQLPLEEWKDVLPDSGFEVFHTPEALAVMEKYAEGNLRLFAGFRGQELVGLFPVFVRNQWGLRFILSPPPGLSVPRLGPILLPSSPKQRKREKLNEQFTESILDVLDADTAYALFGTVASPVYADPRPYISTGFSASPRFSYVLDLKDTDEDDVLGSFTRDLRKEIRKRDELEISIEREGATAAERICGDLKQRHAEQGLTYPTPQPFAGDLVTRLGDRARVYVARGPDGEFLSGVTILYSDNEGMFWQGGTKANYDGVSVNSLLHWRVIGDILSDEALDGITGYDLGEVNNMRISRYKSKFNADLVSNYEVKSDLMGLAKKAYSVRRHLMG